MGGLLSFLLCPHYLKLWHRIRWETSELKISLKLQRNLLSKHNFFRKGTSSRHFDIFVVLWSPPNSQQPIPQTPHCRGRPPIGGEDGGKSASLDDLQPRLGALLEPQPFNGNLPTRIHLFKRPTGPIVCEMVHLGVFERFSSTGAFTRFDDLSSWEASRWPLFGGDGAL